MELSACLPFSGIPKISVLLWLLVHCACAYPLERSCEFQTTKKLFYPVGSKWEIRVGSHKDLQYLDCSCLPSVTVQCIPSRKKCPRMDDCLKIVDVPEQCCPKCADIANEPEALDESSVPERRSLQECYHNGVLHENGQRWSPDSNTTAIRPHLDNQCVQCDCQSGQTMCYLKTCPALACDKMVPSPDSCCPTCAGGISPSIVREESFETAAVSAFEEPADEESDTYPESPEDDKAECISGNERYEDGAQWNPTIPPFGKIKCVLCECTSGNVKCNRVACPVDPPCANPISKPGHCCPVCPTETNEIANVSDSGPYLCLKSKDYLVYEHLHGETVEIVLRLPEDEMLWIHSWTMNDNLPTQFSAVELKLWEFRAKRTVEDYKLLGTAKSRRVGRFMRRINKIRHTCRQRCSKRMERLVQVLRIQAAQAGRKSNCPEASRPVDTRL